MRRVFLGLAFAVAVVVWQLQGNAAPLRREPGEVEPEPRASAPAMTPKARALPKNAPTRATTDVKALPAPVSASALPTEAKAEFRRTASSFVPPHQRAEPGVMGRIIGVRLAWFNEDLAAQEPSPEWTKEVLGALEKAFALMPDSHLLSVDCRETTCKIEVIHEDDARALGFNDELPTSPVSAALPDDFVSFLERDADGQLKNSVFVERDSRGLRQEVSDFLGLDEE